MSSRLLIITIFCFSVVFLGDINFSIQDINKTTNVKFTISHSEAQAYNEDRGAARRTARRTARRVNRRHSHYYSLPKNCTKVFINGQRYFFCGGIYYMETIDNNENVFIIVNP